MEDRINRPRQLLKLADYLGPYGNNPMAVALGKLAVEDGIESDQVRSRLTTLVLWLPTMVKEQSERVLGSTAHKYTAQVDRVIQHFSGQAIAGGCNAWLSVFDVPAGLALGALGDLIEMRMQQTSPDVESLSTLSSSVEELIEQIRASDDLDDDVRHYLLTVAVHLRQMIEHYDIFGVDGIVDVQGRFVAEMFNRFPDLIPNGEPAEDEAPANRFTRVLWNLTCAAAVLTGLTTDGVAIANHVRALLPGHQ